MAAGKHARCTSDMNPVDGYTYQSKTYIAAVTDAKKEAVSAMVGSHSQLELRNALEASGAGPLGTALQVADRMSISDIRDVLEDGVAISDPEQCHRFITEWLQRLEPVERLAAALAVSRLSTTHLVEIPHAEDSSLAEILLASEGTLDRLKSELSDYRSLAESPDTSFNTKFVRTMEEGASQVLDAAADQLRGTREELLRLVRQSAEQG